MFLSTHITLAIDININAKSTLALQKCFFASGLRLNKNLSAIGSLIIKRPGGINIELTI